MWVVRIMKTSEYIWRLYKIRQFGFAIVLQVLWLHSNTADQSNQPAVNVTVYYETLCPGSAQFVTTQVNSTWMKLKDNVNITLVPYGNARQEKTKEGKWNFTCQHGPKECLGNKIQACGLHYLYPIERIPFTVCFMNHNTYPFSYTEQCFNKTSKIEKLNECVNSTKGDNLLAINGNITHSVKPSIKAVPSITFNGIHNYTLENQARANLLKVVCNLIQGQTPPACANGTYNSKKN